MAGPGAWGMHGEHTPLFAEYLVLAGKAGWGDLLAKGVHEIDEHDALIIVDMQNDFVPVDEVNKEGGAFAVADGGTIAPLIVQLVEHFAERGGTVVATRDYHPKCHCSFIPENGPFPVHCVQGSPGSYFYEPIADCVMQQRSLGKKVDVVFKGFHEDVDSFGCFEYPDEGSSWSRLANRKCPERLHGCSLAAWTGCTVLECSNIEADINAPPDVLASHRGVKLAEHLTKRGAKRIFCCGLALDFCVLDTALNGRKAGFNEVFIILDAARAAHLPSVGKIGSGFLQDLAELQAKMAASGVQLLPSAAVLPGLSVVNPLLGREDIPSGFPAKLGPFALVVAKKLALTIDRATHTWKASGPRDIIKTLASNGIESKGAIAPLGPVTLDVASRKRIGIPQDAVEFTWAYPVGGGHFSEQARAYLSITTPSAAFFVQGGFVYLDGTGRVTAVMAVTLGEGLLFDAPRPWRSSYTKPLCQRWQPVTMPFLREKGVMRFTWLNPGESIRPEGKEAGELWAVGGPHGAFAYLFHEDLAATDSRDVIFQITRAASRATPVLGRVGAEEEEDASVLRKIRSKAALGPHSAKQKVMSKFKEWDIDGNQRLTAAEMVAAIQRLDPGITEDQLNRVFAAADANKDGYIDAREFLNWLYK